MLNRVTLDVSAQRTAKPTLAAECYQHLLETENDTRMRHDRGKAQCEDETPQWRYAKTTRLQHCQDSLRQTTRPDALGRAPRRPPPRAAAPMAWFNPELSYLMQPALNVSDESKSRHVVAHSK